LVIIPVNVFPIVLTREFYVAKLSLSAFRGLAISAKRHETHYTVEDLPVNRFLLLIYSLEFFKRLLAFLFRFRALVVTWADSVVP
jgi:hypothetical protein